jgi:hypothetical protein
VFCWTDRDKVGRCHHGTVCPQAADGGTVSSVEGMLECVE